MFSQTLLVKLPDFTEISLEKAHKHRAGHSLIVICRHEKGLTAEPLSILTSTQNTPCSIFLTPLSMRHSGQRQQEETWFNRPADPCSFVTYCCGMGLRQPDEPADNRSAYKPTGPSDKMKNQTSKYYIHPQIKTC